MSTTSIRLKQELEAPLDDLAHRLQRSRNWLINKAIEDFLARQGQEQERWLETLPALDSVRSGRTVAGDEVHAWLESWGSAAEKPAP
ncbi:CopG family ribbon-helix-helix protein [Pseudothauera rhizosphaerae]|uniref:Ribbon-helix-helix protein, CopG family n=1 Tax=Pseudothauera rhizosphaerae TaxID=2565932 RepID=A0A4S4AES2_9RHOO|nr:ribbon-helix-helix protein, CopG family [Pseudothauera rhizosphaerae]THF57670.1 ribbon-helix-helix protein, CopG family [Pseudothauera rhizosphaerae]